MEAREAIVDDIEKQTMLGRAATLEDVGNVAAFPASEQWLDLTCWDEFETEHPDTFISMYQFWCRPI